MTKDPYEQGRECGEHDGDWRDNPYRKGTAAWFAFNDGLQDGGYEDDEGTEGIPAWG